MALSGNITANIEIRTGMILQWWGFQSEIGRIWQKSMAMSKAATDWWRCPR